MANNYNGGAPAPNTLIRDGSKPKKPKPKKLGTYRYSRTQTTKGGVKRRARKRLKAIGPVEGVNAKDGITGGEARKIRQSWMDEGKPKRPKGKGGKPGSGRGASSPYDPLAPLSGRSLRREVNAQAHLEYDPQFRQLDSERRISAQQSANVGNWYQQYQQTVQAAAQQNAAYTKGFQDAAYQQANTAAQVDTTQNAQLQQQAQQQAQLRGTTVDPSLAQTAQQGVAARQAQGTAMGGVLAATGQAQQSLLQGRVGTAAGEAVQAQQLEVQRRNKIEQLAQELKADMGKFKVAKRGELRDSERKYALERSAFQLDVTQEQNDAANDAADNAREDRKARQSAARDRLLNRKTRTEILKNKGEAALDKNADLADDGRRNFSTDYDEYKLRTRPDKGDGDGKGDSNFTPTQVRSGRRTLRQYLESGRTKKDLPDGYDPLLARAAAQILKQGGVSPELARKIKRNYGFTPRTRKGGLVGIGNRGVNKGKDLL